MAASGFTPISLYYSTTASAVPTAGNLANGELALNTADMKLYAKNSAGVVTLLASNAATSGVSSFQTSLSGLTPSTSTTGAVTLAGTLGTSSGGTGLTSFTSGGVVYASSTSALATGSALTWDGSLFTVSHASGVDGRGIRLVNSSNAQTWETRIGVQSLENTAYAIKDITAGTVPLLIQASTGNVGIGTNSPAVKLNVVGASTSGIVNVTALQNPVNSAGTGHGASLVLHSTPDSNRGVAIASSSTANFAVDNAMLFYTSASSSLTEKMRITSAGNVGIGTSSPSRQLELSTFIAGAPTGTGFVGGALRLSNLTEYEANYGTGGGNPDFLGSIEFYAGDTSTGTGVRTAIKTTVDAYYNENSLCFYTAPTNTAGILERFRIAPAGQIGIGGANYGTAGQVLTSGGSGAAPTWAAAGGGSQAFVAFGSTGGL